MRKAFQFPTGLLALCGLMLSVMPVFANIPGGGAGAGPNVTLSTNTSAGTITMANGIVTAVISMNSSQILELTYLGHQVTAGGTGGTDAFYWQGQSSAGEETPINGIVTVVVNPATNSGDSAEISIANLYTNQGTNSPFVADAYYHFSMFRGSPGIYAAEIMSRTTNTPGGGADIPSFTCKLNGDFFAWLAQDNGRSLLRETPTESDNATSGINNAPKEVTLLNQGLLAGQFECKYDYAGDLGLLHFIGWCSTNQTTNFGLWMVHPTREYWSGGPGHPEIVGQIDMLNCTFKGVHFGFGSDLNFTNGETWSRVCGPVFLYFNQVPPGTANPWVPLYADVYAQAAAESGAWPYGWFTPTNYAGASSRGAVSGKLVIRDSGNPNASAAGMWVGVLQRLPSSLDPPTTDFQNMDKGYQFWVKTDTSGNFTISNVVAGANYTLLSYGPGAIGLYQSQSFGTAPPVSLYIPPTPFSITVTGGQTNNLGNLTWAPARVGQTVWEIGVPDRDTREFRHGADYWHGDFGDATNFAANWAPWQDYTLDFPNGVNYTNGRSRWSADWPNAQPNSLSQASGNLNNTTQNIFFNLASAPASGANASLYFAFAADYQTPVQVTINGVNAGTVTPAYSTDAMIRMESHGIFCDSRLSFSSSDLKAGQNEIQLTTQKSGYLADSVLYDYIRLELTGYVPPAPAGLTAIAGNGLVVLDWPASSGATSYNVLRSTTSGSGYSTLVTNVTGPVVGSDVPDATYTDNSALNDTPYYYVAQAVNPNGASADSVEAGATPSAATPSAPAAPTGLTLTPGNMQATLNWNASPGAATYAIQRTVITGGAVPNDPGAEVFTNPDGSAPTNTVNGFVTGTNYTDTGLANGVVYSYVVSAANANGQSANSAAVSGTPEPLIPATPTGLVATLGVSNLVSLSWNPVASASSYVLQRATSVSGPYTRVDYPAWLSFLTDGPLSNNTTYYYEVASASLAGVSTNSAPVSVSIGVAAPSLTAVAGNAQVSLTWTVSAGATNYVLESSTTNGGPYTTILTTTNTNYLNTGLVNGTTYYYVVHALGPDGQSPLSAQANATPSAAPAGSWINTITTSPQGWNVNSNWGGGGAFPNSTQAVVSINSAIAANQTITLNQAVTIGAMNIGSPSDAASFNVTGNGGTLLLDNTPATASLLQLSTSKGDTISAPMAVNGGLLVTNASTSTFTLSGGISGATNGVTLNGPVILGGSNTYTGNTTVLGGNVTVSGGTINSPGGAITVGNGVTGVSFNVTGGTVTANTLNVAPVANSTGDSASITGSGSAVFTNVNLGGGGDTSGPLTINTTGSVALGALIDYKDLQGTGPSATSGLIINNGAVTATSVIIQNTGSGANMNMTGGSLTIGNSSSSGAFKIGNSTSTRGGWLTMTGGSLTYLGTDGLLLNTASGGANGANISGAASVASLTGVTLNQVNAAGTTSWLVVSAGATLYLGGVGLVINQPGATVYASLGTATVGAITNWSSSAPITLGGNTTFQAADASMVAHDISLGGAVSGGGGLTKTGAGALTLSGGNTYTGGTTISAGTLLANNTAGSGTGAGAVTVASGGTLGGAGFISGAVTVNAGGALAPGSPSGVLTLSNSLTLSSGGTTLMQVGHSPPANNAVNITGALTEGGTLNVTNIGAGALAAGDSFKLFNAGNYGGAFANVVLPPLPAGLGWNTNALSTNGALSVVVAGAPVIDAFSVLTSGLVFTGMGGVANANYYLLTSTDITAPVSNWTRLFTNQFDNNGDFNCTNPPGAGQPQEFYLLELP
ncbi:MAG: polysaccharide lyase family protein [Verrucomicrobiota bacterium]|jgi:rhamnogalacturonan endolyase